MPEKMTLEARRDHFSKTAACTKPRIVICAGTGCVAGGSLRIHEKFCQILKDKGLDVSVSFKEEQGDYAMIESGCQGFCQMGPLVTIQPKGFFYVKVQLEDVEEIVNKSVIGGEFIDRLCFKRPDTGEIIHEMNKIPFYERQNRLTLGLCGNIDVHDLDEFVYNGGYYEARKAVLEMTDVEICDEMLASGLRGRGGGGFPTGR
jgi:NADH-quinone oxidoreductase subunit F